MSLLFALFAIKTILAWVTFLPVIQSAEWGYEGSHGAENWPIHFPACGKDKQSPINVFEGDVSVDNGIGPLTYVNYDTATGIGMNMKNNGHSVAVALSGNTAVTIEGGGLPPGVFRAFQFHFHWGEDEDVGSEHLISGISYPIELHIVHYNTKYPSPGVAVSKPDGLAVLGFFFEVIEEGPDNVNYIGIVNNLPAVQVPGSEINITSVALNSLLPTTYSKFYRYSGSLTTPSCQESVTWTLFKDTIKLSEVQLQSFRILFDPHGSTLVNNFRPVQPLNQRQVISNFAPDIRWSYSEGAVDADHWSQYYFTCGGTQQSPVDITTLTSQWDTTLGQINFHNYDNITTPSYKLTNTGHTVEVDLTDGDISISGGGLPETYQAAYIQFHWGSTSQTGSEHTVDSLIYPMEAQIVHYKQSHGDLTKAVSQPDGVAVLGIFFEISDQDNPALYPLLRGLQDITNPGTSLSTPSFSLDYLLPTNKRSFYRYSGSLTAPGCSEGVIWTIFEDTIPISACQLQAFRLLNSAAKDEEGITLPLSDNYRPVQDLNQRIITRTFAAPNPKWSYRNPNDWPKEHEECKDTPTSRQSPINIITKDVLYTEIPKLTLKGYDKAPGVAMEMANNGHTVTIRFTSSDMEISGGGLDGTYKADHLHFHWGASNDKGSEHQINNKAYAMEMHIVHYNSIYPDVSTACKKPKGLAVLAFLFEVSSTPNPAYAEIVKKLGDIILPGSKTTIGSIPILSLLPGKFDAFYRYEGSLTTPGCNETVTWTVYHAPIQISEEQLNRFRSLKSSEIDPKTSENLFLVGNTRPPQNLNGRKVLSNSGGPETKGRNNNRCVPLTLNSGIQKLLCWGNS